MLFTIQPWGRIKPPLSYGVRINDSNPLSRGLQLFAIFNEAGGSTVYDFSHNRSNGTITPTVGGSNVNLTWSSMATDPTTTHHGLNPTSNPGFWSFGTGAPSYVDFGTAPRNILSNVAAFSLAFVGCSDTASSGSMFVGVGDDATHAVGMGPSSDGHWYYNVGGATFGRITNPADRFLHATLMTYDGTQTGNANRLHGWFDGVQQTLSFTGTIPATTPTMTSHFLAGLQPAGVWTNQDGFVEYVALWDRVLSDSEIALFTQRPYDLLTPRLPLPLTMFVSAPPAPPIVTGATPDEDTIRGGADVIIFGIGPLNGVTEALKWASLPGGWMDSTVNTASVSPTLRGLELSAGPTVNSSATIDVPTVEDGVDVAINVENLIPRVSGSSLYNVADLSFVGATATTTLSLQFNPTLSTTSMVAMMTSTAGVLAGGIIKVGDNVTKTSLRLVRSEGMIWAFIGQRTINTDLDQWTSLTPVGRVLVPTETGTIRFSVSNLNNVGRVTSRITNFTTRCHAKIDGRLIDNKEVTSARRIAGTVPAATLEDVGDTDILVFGPGITGTFPIPFTYTLPLPFTAGRRIFDRLRIYTDTALYDPEEGI